MSHTHYEGKLLFLVREKCAWHIHLEKCYFFSCWRGAKWEFLWKFPHAISNWWRRFSRVVLKMISLEENNSLINIEMYVTWMSKWKQNSVRLSSHSIIHAWQRQTSCECERSMKNHFRIYFEWEKRVRQCVIDYEAWEP